MKLIEFIKQLEDKKSNLYNESFVSDQLTLAGQSLKLFEKQLYDCDEFQNVVRINFLDMPSYAVDKETQEPLSYSRNFLGGDTDSKTVVNYRFNSADEIKFNKFVDLYSIRIGKIYNASEELMKPGVWVYPTIYNPETFVPKNQIRVIWDPMQLEETLKILGKETPKERLTRMFSEALETMESNLPCEYVVFVRCSNRSISTVVGDGGDAGLM